MPRVPNGRGKLLGIFDGHGGADVAEFSATNFPVLFKARMRDVNGAAAEALRRSVFRRKQQDCVGIGRAFRDIGW